MHQFHKFTPAWNSTCFGQFLCLSSGVYSLYTQQWYISYNFVDSFRARPSCSKAVYKIVWHRPLLSGQWINSWWWTEGLSETCRVSCQNKFVKLVHVVGFIVTKFVTMPGHTNVKFNKKISDNVIFLKPNPTTWHSREGIVRTFLLEPISLIYVLESVLFFDIFSLYSKQLLSKKYYYSLKCSSRFVSHIIFPLWNLISFIIPTTLDDEVLYE
jgi:hypothetical protein